MKEKKTFEIKTKAFELKIHWNGTLVSTQLCILICMFAMSFLSDSISIKSFCKIAVLLDIFSILVTMFSVDKDNNEDAEDKKEQEPMERESIEVEKDKSSTTSKSPVKNVSGTIKNKVPAPGNKNKDKVPEVKVTTEVDIEGAKNSTIDFEDWS